MKVNPKFPRRYGCCVCYKCFTTNFELNRHSNQHTAAAISYICDICNKGFNTRDSRKRHHQSVHSDTKHFSCQLCNCAFKLKEQLRAHEKTKKHLQRVGAEDHEDGVVVVVDDDDGGEQQQRRRIQDAIDLLEANHFNIVVPQQTTLR